MRNQNFIFHLHKLQRRKILLLVAVANNQTYLHGIFPVALDKFSPSLHSSQEQRAILSLCWSRFVSAQQHCSQLNQSAVQIILQGKVCQAQPLT